MASPILSIPNEILDMISEHLSVEDSICLGLTCRKLWGLHKEKHMEIINLANSPRLWRRLEHAFGPEWIFVRWSFRPPKHSFKKKALDVLERCWFHKRLYEFEEKTVYNYRDNKFIPLKQYQKEEKWFAKRMMRSTFWDWYDGLVLEKGDPMEFEWSYNAQWIAWHRVFSL